MNYIKDTLKLVKKNIFLVIPLLVLTIISRYIYASTSVFDVEYLKKLFQPVKPLLQFGKVERVSKAFLAFTVGGGIVSFLLMFIIIPTSYIMINKAIDTGSTSLEDFFPSLKSGIIKYIFYIATRILFWFVFCFASLSLLLFLGILMFLPKNFHIGLVATVFICILLLAMFIYILQSLWFASMLSGNQTAERGLKKSFKIVYHMFPSFATIVISINIIGLALEALIFRLVNISILRPAITGIIPAFTQFILITYFLIVYKDISKPIYLEEE